MPLSPLGERKQLHLRRIELAGYERPDGRYDIEARMTDTKTTGYRVNSTGREIRDGELIHDMWVRMVVDAKLNVLEISASTDSSPFPVCPQATKSLQVMVGDSITPGWSLRVKQKLGGAASCTHLMELLLPMATAAFQTIAPVRLNGPEKIGVDGKPARIDSCYAYSSEGDAVRERWPKYYTGPTSTKA